MLKLKLDVPASPLMVARVASDVMSKHWPCPLQLAGDPAQVRYWQDSPVKPIGDTVNIVCVNHEGECSKLSVILLNDRSEFKSFLIVVIKSKKSEQEI